MVAIVGMVDHSFGRNEAACLIFYDYDVNKWLQQILTLIVDTVAEAVFSDRHFHLDVIVIVDYVCGCFEANSWKNIKRNYICDRRPLVLSAVGSGDDIPFIFLSFDQSGDSGQDHYETFFGKDNNNY